VNPLGDYLDSLARLQGLDPDEVLPAHEYRFKGLGIRLDQLIEHHSERLDIMEKVLAEQPGMTAWDLTRSLTWSRPWDEIPRSCSALPMARP